MRIVDESERPSTTVLPPAAPALTGARASIHPKLKPLCPHRMAAAAKAEEEVAAICEEISQVMRGLPANKDARPARGVSNRPSVRRRPVRKAPR